MGESTGSMFYAFAAFLVIYFIGAAQRQAAQKVGRKAKREMR